jgi:hypothetical protein
MEKIFGPGFGAAQSCVNLVKIVIEIIGAQMHP